MKKKVVAPKAQQEQDKFPVCFIVEGFTEEHYVNVLNEFFEKKFNTHNCEGGNANGVLKKAQKFIKENEGVYQEFIIIYDADTRHEANKQVLASENDLGQIPNVQLKALDVCFEKCLLCHFENPKESGERCDTIIRKLKKHIPKYDKNNFQQLKKHIDIEKVKKMAKQFNCSIVKDYFISKNLLIQ